MTTTTEDPTPLDILGRMSCAADVCRNEFADDIADLLDEAIAEITRLRAEVYA